MILPLTRFLRALPVAIPVGRSLFLTFVFLSLFVQMGISQQTPGTGKVKAKRYYEVTEDDITRVKGIDADSISVLGIHLGMPMQQAKMQIARKQGVFFRQDKFNNYRLYLYDYEKRRGRHIPLAYFKWENRDSGLKELLLYRDFGNYMAGKSRKLVTKEALSYYEEGVGKHFLGYPEKKEDILNVPSQGIRHTAYYYEGKAYQVIKQVKGERVKYTFGIFDQSLSDTKKQQAN